MVCSAEPCFYFYLAPEAKARGVSFTPPRSGDAGFDIAAAQNVSVQPGGSALIPTGLHLAIPSGWVGLIRDRSSVAARGAVTVAGVIDSGYRGEVKVLIYNLGREELRIDVGERIAQCVIVPHLAGCNCAERTSLDTLGETERGGGGFGSTGR